MRSLRFLLLVFPTVLLVGCKATPPKQVSSTASSSAASSRSAILGGVYHGDLSDFTEDVLHDGSTKVLFFHAAWCPICRKTDTQLARLYERDGYPLSVYKVDYDKEQSLKMSYGVTYQHTFVLIDGEGNFIQRVEAPSTERLKRLLQQI